MNRNEGKVLFGNAVRYFLNAGGSLRYQPVEDETGLHWLLFGVQQDRQEIQVFIARNAEPKVFRSANAVVNYHRSMFPNDTVVAIPVPPRRPGEEPSD